MQPSALQNFFKRKTPEEQPTWLILLGIASIAVYAFSRTGFMDAAEISSAVATLTGFWGLYKYGKVVNSHILFRFIWVALIFQFISWALSVYVTPEWARETPQLDKITRWFTFIPLAWWVAQRKNAVWLIWGSAALGILISPWVTGEGIPEIIRGLNGERVFFGLRQQQHASLFFGIILIGLLCFTKRVVALKQWLAIPLLLILLYCLLIVYINASRQAWLALLLTALFMASFFTVKRLKKATGKQKLIILTVFVLSIFSSATLILSSDKIVNRVMKEKEALSAIASLNFDNVPYSSFGIRLHSWVAATDFIKEKPVFGWGSNGRTLVMKHTKWLPDWVQEDFGHLHNTYIEMLVNFGIVGLAFYLFMWVYLTKSLFREIHKGTIEKDIGYFFMSFLCFWSIMNCFEAYQNFWTGVFYFTVFVTGIQARVWRVKLQPTTSEETNKNTCIY
ncbi:O-antigen ligase domain-containing protein [Marinomonas rhizomae]|uniref:Oligosaccharide repeat unit polymerase n=1 Tax=Marinomonas rhizomae TaxID=491948 RepID=A0A366J874_9GAMM|nr:O-antigen ligase family protein [Marinomonas rhizomae]RBP83241.1 oligosaccharide repeat unit polymerase [Marinomonas rhizomae]RNF69417.1 O-antigen ligase domain-containing protein [Marinomonas rhizomae]